MAKKRKSIASHSFDNSEERRLPDPTDTKEIIETVTGQVSGKQKARYIPPTKNRQRINTMINRELHKQMKDIAFDEGKTFPDVLEEAIKQYLSSK